MTACGVVYRWCSVHERVEKHRCSLERRHEPPHVVDPDPCAGTVAVEVGPHPGGPVWRVKARLPR